MKAKRIMGFFLSLVMFTAYLPSNPIASYADDGIKIDENFKDENFRKYVSDNFDKNNDGILSNKECDDVTDISIEGKSVSSLRGIEHFKNLTNLNCGSNKLTSLDLSQNINLTELRCYANKLQSLDVSKNKKLTELFCGGNQIQSLDVSENTNLTNLNCGNNKLTSLDVSKNINLTILYCNQNELTSLDVSKNKKLTTLECYQNKIQSLDVTNNTSLDTLWCYQNNLTSLDVTNNTKLNALSFKENPLTSVKLINKTYQYNQFTPITYTVKVIKGSKKIPFGKLPQGFDKNRIKSNVKLEEDGFTWDGKSNSIKFSYQLCENPEEIVDAEITVKEVEFDPENVVSMVVKEQPTKLNYTEGENLDLKGLVVTLTDNQGLTKDVTFADFETYKITTAPANEKELTLADSGKPVALTKGSLQDETANLTVNKKVFDSENVVSMVVKEQPKKLTYTEGEKLDLEGLVVTLTDNQGLTKDVTFADFETYKITAIPANETELTLANNEKKVMLIREIRAVETANLTVNKKVFDPENVVSMVVKEQPKKLTYTEGEKLDLTGLVVTLTDKQGLTKDVAFKDFADNVITAEPTNDTALTLANNAKKVTLTKGKLTAETDALTVNAKVFDPAHVEKMVVKEQPTKLSYIEGEKLDLTGLVVTLTDNQGLIKDVEFKDFASNNITTDPENETELTLANNGNKVKLTKGNLSVETKSLTVNKKVIGPVDPLDPNDEKPADTSKYWTVTFETEDETKGTVSAKNTVYVLKTETKTLADITAPEVTAKEGYEFDKWVPTLDKSTAINKDLKVKAQFKKVVPVPTPTDPKVVGPVDPTDPNGGKPADTSKYYTVTFKTEDETKGTVSAKNTVYVLKTETKTLADITAPEVTAKEGYEFDKWEPTLDKSTAIDKDLKVKAHFKKVKEKSYNKKQQVANNSKMPKTANSMNIELYTVFMILSVALLVIAVKKEKRVNR